MAGRQTKQALLMVLWLSTCMFILCSSASLSSRVGGRNISFTYKEGKGERGPKEWGSLSPKWRACGNGKLQSPIDVLSHGVEVSPELGKLQRDYKPAPATVKNSGHDIMVKWKADAGQIRVNETYYKLVQFHWHTPSEHTFNGSRYELELHVVHSSSNGGTAVIGIVYKYGKPDPFLSKVLLRDIKKTRKGGKDIEVGIVNPGDIKFGRRKYYRYIGSLTTPPCTEGVVWTIVKKVRTVSRAQVKALRNAIYKGFKTNARPTQGANERVVKLYK
ncbi:unnamed protein product [Linum tenue]|uniref:carbonic anhydrase n=1 Tax=Linum tenue TaxID=586396 RepID=A0AAV0GP97_9ROSI|nr:unnamed protein product [Linum tenue]